MNAKPQPQYELGDDVLYNKGRLSLSVIANDRFIIWPSAQGQSVNVYKLATSPDRAQLVKGAFEIWMTEIPGLGAHFFHAIGAQRPEQLERMTQLVSGYILKESEGDQAAQRVGEIVVYSENGCRLILEHKSKAGVSFYEAPCRQPVIS
jgi:hypothetical protein